MPQHSGAHVSSYNGVHRRHVPPTQGYPAATVQSALGYSQYYDTVPSSTLPHVDRVQQQPGLLSGRYTHHKYSHERSSASSTSTLPDPYGPILSSSHNWGNQVAPDVYHPISSNTRVDSAPSGGIFGSFLQGYPLDPAARQNMMDSGMQSSQQYHYTPVQGLHPPSRSLTEFSGASISLRYESSHSPAPSESSQYRLSPGFSMQSASSPDSMSDPTDENPPRRRRRTKLTDCSSAASISSEASSTCNSPQLGTLSSSSSSRPGSRDISAKPGPSRKVRGKRSRSSKQPTALGEGPSFNVFMVKPSPAMQEPSGATYISTVNFDADSTDAFEHGPTDLPPRPYIGGPDATSPWKPRKNLGTIPGSAMDYLPVVEARMKRLEGSLNAYVEYRGERAIKNAILPGMDSAGSSDDMDCDTPLKEH